MPSANDKKLFIFFPNFFNLELFLETLLELGYKFLLLKLGSQIIFVIGNSNFSI